MYGIGEVRTSLLAKDHTQMNCGMGLYDKDKVYYMPDADGKVIVDGKKCTVLSKDGYDNTAVLTLGDKKYDVVKMPDGKYWLAQNLDWLPEGVDFISSGPRNQTTPTACYYNYVKSSKGLLYNGYAVSYINGILPSGWRVANSDDYTGLITSIGGSSSENLRKLKSVDGGWNPSGYDTYGFKLIKTGAGTTSAWSSIEMCYIFTPDVSGADAQVRIRIENNSYDKSTNPRNTFQSVRLVKD